IVKANISIRNLATDVTREVTTDDAGFYEAPNLLPGTYEVAVSAAGFSSLIRKGITLEVGTPQVLNLRLLIGRTSDKVEVTGEAPTIELASSIVGAVVNSATIKELPLNGRSWTDLATLEPGVAAIQTQPPFAV